MSLASRAVKFRSLGDFVGPPAPSKALPKHCVFRVDDRPCGKRCKPGRRVCGEHAIILDKVKGELSFGQKKPDGTLRSQPIKGAKSKFPKGGRKTKAQKQHEYDELADLDSES